jgi:hypothetical protein
MYCQSRIRHFENRITYDQEEPKNSLALVSQPQRVRDQIRLTIANPLSHADRAGVEARKPSPERPHQSTD